jgi:hypothetical protein
VDTDIV